MSEGPRLSPEEIVEIETKASTKLTQLHKSQRIIGKEVLNIIRKEAILLQSPFENEELCAFVCQKKDRLFVYINSQIPIEKQYFAAAHELYHIWYDKEYLTNPEILSSETINDETNDARELKANLFAAIFLVPKHVLEQELLFIAAQKNEITPMQTIELAHTFQVPFKSMCRRLYEVGFIDKLLFKRLVEFPNVSLIRKRLQLEEPSPSQPIIHYEGFVDNLLKLYKANQISPEFLRDNLSFLNLEPSEFEIDLSDDLPSEEEIDKLLAEDEK